MTADQVGAIDREWTGCWTPARGSLLAGRRRASEKSFDLA